MIPFFFYLEFNDERFHRVADTAALDGIPTRANGGHFLLGMEILRRRSISSITDLSMEPS
jgi:hypothetical protein